MTQTEEEQVYCHFVEDFLNVSLSQKNTIFMIALPQMMHGSFIKSQLQLKVLSRVNSAISAMDDCPEFVLKVLQEQIQKTQEPPQKKEAAEKEKPEHVKAGRKRKMVNDENTKAGRSA